MEVYKMCQMGTRHSSDEGVENCQEAFATELNLLTLKCHPILGKRFLF
jgi:hypothetical protein